MITRMVDSINCQAKRRKVEAITTNHKHYSTKNKYLYVVDLKANVTKYGIENDNLINGRNKDEEEELIEKKKKEEEEDEEEEIECRRSNGD